MAHPKKQPFFSLTQLLAAQQGSPILWTNETKLQLLSCVFVTVWEKLKVQKLEERWQPEHEEEYEDSLGNVVNRKTFEDLKRQGLL